MLRRGADTIGDHASSLTAAMATDHGDLPGLWHDDDKPV